MTVIDRIEALLKEVEHLTEELKVEVGPGGTKEQWSAISALGSAHYDLHGAFGWLLRHDERMAEAGQP